MNEDKPPIVHETKDTGSEDRERERKNARDNLRHAASSQKSKTRQSCTSCADGSAH